MLLLWGSNHFFFMNELNFTIILQLLRLLVRNIFVQATHKCLIRLPDWLVCRFNESLLDLLLGVRLKLFYFRVTCSHMMPDNLVWSLCKTFSDLCLFNRCISHASFLLKNSTIFKRVIPLLRVSLHGFHMRLLLTQVYDATIVFYYLTTGRGNFNPDMSTCCLRKNLYILFSEVIILLITKSAWLLVLGALDDGWVRAV